MCPDLYHLFSKTYCELSNSLDSIEDKTGKSAITAVVITAPDESGWLTFRLPPLDGFRPKIHTKCWNENERKK